MNEIHPVDMHVGQRIRLRRWTLGMTQHELAERIGVRFQQVQKYEAGKNRTPVSRLWDISVALSVDVTYFYDGFESRPEGGAVIPSGAPLDKEAAQLVRSFHHMPSEPRRKLMRLTRALVQESAGG